MTRTPRIVLAVLMTMPAWAVGTVNQSLAQIPGSTNFVFTENWTADAANGSVPTTVISGTISIQGFRIVSVEIAPGSPAPTNNYTVTLTDFSGADMLGGSGASQSSTTASVLPSLSTAPPIYGSLTVNVTGNVVNSAKGAIFVYFAPVSQVIGNTPTGASLTGNNLLTGNNTFQGTGTYTGTNTFSGPTSITGTTTLNGCQYVDTNQTFAAALAAVSNPGCIVVNPGTFPVSVNSTVPAGVTLAVSDGGTLSIANAVTLTINGPFQGGPYQAFTYTGSGVAVFGNNTLPISPLWFPGTDIGAQINNAYAACPSQGCVMVLTPQSNGACYAFTTPIVLNTSGKPVNLIGGNNSNTSGNLPGGSCLNYTPLTATTAITIDWVPSVGGGYVPQGGISNIILTNTTSYTNGGPAQGGGSASLATGIATGTTNGGIGFGPFNNMAIKGFHVGYLHQNSSAGAWGTQFNNVSFAYNDTGFSSTVATEVLNFVGGTFAVNGIAFNMANTTAAFLEVHFDSNFGPSTISGATGANVNFVAPHFENLNVGASSCGANSMEQITSSGPAVNITGGDAADDCNTGTNTVYWFTLNGGAVNGLVLSTAGRTPSTAVFIVNDTATSVNVVLPTAGTALKGVVVANTGTLGPIFLSTHASNSLIQSTQYLTGGGQTNPACTFTSGGGTSPSCAFAVNSSDSAGTIIATTGTGAPTISGTITLTYGNALGKNASGCVYMLSNAGAGQWGSLAQVVDTTPSINSDLFTWTNATGATPAGVALSTSTAYRINYWCIGR